MFRFKQKLQQEKEIKEIEQQIERDREERQKKKQQEKALQELKILEELKKKSNEFESKYGKEMFTESSIHDEYKYYLQHIFNV